MTTIPFAPADFNVTPELFMQWRTPRFGEQNPTQLNNPVWEWLIKSKHCAYRAGTLMGFETDHEDIATWCFERFGQSVTILPDGRTIYIGGEHEDYYDPDFYIYNDVVVVNPDGSIDIYGYPKTTFQPTDFHSATLIGDEIIIVGCLGYYDAREAEKTPIYSLNIHNFMIKTITTTGENPHWIFKHNATLDSEQHYITIQQGEIFLGKGKSFLENIDQWRLDTHTWHWQRLTKLDWMRFEFKRSDDQDNYLWDCRRAIFSRKANWSSSYQKEMQELTAKLGKTPDLTMVETLYQPPIIYTTLPENEEEYRVCRIQVAQTTVRYVEKNDTITMIIEDSLPDAIVNTLKTDLLNKLSAIANIEYGCYPIESI